MESGALVEGIFGCGAVQFRAHAAISEHGVKIVCIKMEAVISIKGYNIQEVVFQDTSKILVRAQRGVDSKGVLLKAPLYADAIAARELDYEFFIRTSFPLDGVVPVIDKMNIENSILLEMEDAAGTTLETYLTGTRPSIGACLHISVQLARLVEALHCCGICHRDIRPANFLIHGDTLALSLWDLGAAVNPRMPDTRPSLGYKFDAALEYISPEQSGRTDMGEDLRSDLYSLGITLYFLFTGKLPFERTDINELVHAHIARLPANPSAVNAALPTVVADIILRLLQKKPAERYKNAGSLRHDLQVCRTQFEIQGHIAAFIPDSRILNGTIQINTRLYGRETVIAHALEAFDRIGQASELVMLYGSSGIGKSAVMKDLRTRLQSKNIVLLVGKCDERRRNTPFEILAQALRELIYQVRDDRHTFRASVLSRVTTPVGMLTDIIPELKSTFGDQQSVPDLPPGDAQKRVAMAFAQFIDAVATPERPLVIFLDDLQWADTASLYVLQLLFSAHTTKHILVIGAYRDNEVEGKHPLAQALAIIQGVSSEYFQRIRLSPLTPGAVTELLADTLASSAHVTRPLADYLLTGTLGNPLFISERLHELQQQSLITFDHVAQQWSWCMEKIVHHAGMGSSLELIVERIQRLPKCGQHAIVYGACVGTQFDLSMLAALMDRTDHETADDLKEALRENLIVAAPAVSKGPGAMLPRTRYMFFHDQVQQAACSLIPLEERNELHLNIGYYLLEKLAEGDVENQLFEIVDHLNQGGAMVADVHERHRLAGINLRAGRKAKSATAYGAAYAYFRSGLALIDDTSWHSAYELCLALHMDAAEAAYLSHQGEASDTLLALARSHARTSLEKIYIQQIQVQSLVFQRKNNDAIAIALRVLRSLDITFPASYDTAYLLMAYARTKWILRSHKIEALDSLPEMRDDRWVIAMRLLQSISAAAYQTLPGLYPFLVLKMTCLSVKYGNTAESPLAYATYGAMVNAIETNNGACYRFGKTALALLEKRADVAIRERTLLIYNLINRLSHEHVHGSLEELKRCYKMAIELGDVEYAAYASNAYCMLLCISGKNLRWVKEEMIRCNLLPAGLRNNDSSNGNDALIQVVANLAYENDDPTRLTGNYFDEDTGFVEILRSSTPSKLFACYVFKMMLCYLEEDYAEGLRNVVIAKRYLNYSKGMILEPIFYFYAALLNYAQHGQSASIKCLRQGTAYKQTLKKWADQVPVNYDHLHLLAEAEHACVRGRTDRALMLYDKAIQRAQEGNYLQYEALGHERAAACWRGKGQRHMARIYVVSAVEAYKKWGCALKVKQLESCTEYSHPEEYKPAGSIIPSLDIATILKASTALSSEVVFDQLLEKLMKFVIENAGAQAGYFILDWGGVLYIEARQSVMDEKSAKLKIPLKESELIPREIVEHVFRSKKDVVLADAQRDPVFALDAVVVKNNVRSVLCIPAVNQGKLVGALYLENNLIVGAFTNDRVELLKLLSGQIAVSIENSILYENLEQKVRERTVEIQVQKEEIERQKQLVEQKSKFKEQFFANMSHEIRTPMTAIIGMSELIFDTPLTQQQMEYAKGIHYSSENLLAIINDILDFSKIEAGKFSFVHKPFQVRDRMSRLQAMLRVLAEEKNITLTVEVDAAIPDQLIGDPLRLHQILLNLTSNAIKFTESGNVWVTVKPVESNESHVVLSFAVRDSGIGIPEDKLNFIFETFSRIEDEMNLQYQGTGLGLFIAKKLVEEQGGSMTVTSQLKEGTTFRFSLPFGRCDALVQEEEKDTVHLSGIRVLLVEDTLFNQVVAEEILKKIITNGQVIVASHGQEAIDKLHEHAVDIILMDIKMPVMDGYTASRHIRSMKAWEMVPILAFTSNANPGEAEKCKAAGMNDYITKPIESKKLKQKIAKLLGAAADTPVVDSGW